MVEAVVSCVLEAGGMVEADNLVEAGGLLGTVDMECKEQCCKQSSKPYYCVL